jgi:hypothetical protein
MPVTTTTFTYSSGPPAIPDSGTFAWSLVVFLLGNWARITDVRVNLNGLSHTFPDDLDFLLLGSGGRNLEFWSDAGGSTLINGNYTIADSAASLLPDAGGIASGTYKPTDYTAPTPETGSNWGGLSFLTINHAGPTGSASFASVFGGQWGSTARRGTSTSGTIPTRIPAASRAGAST